MSRLLRCWPGVVLSVCVASSVCGQEVTSQSGHAITASVSGGGSNATFRASAAAVCPAVADRLPDLTDAATFDLFVDTASDILLIDFALSVSAGSLFRGDATALASHTNSPHPMLITAFPELKASPWITTPNQATSGAGSNALDAFGTMVTHFDTTNDGAQTDFQFGRFTLRPDHFGNAEATLAGTLQTAASPTPVFANFEFQFSIRPVPEPGALSLVMFAGLVGWMAVRRRKNRDRH